MDGTKSTEKIGDKLLITENQRAIERTQQQGAAISSEDQVAFSK
jgi:hypothetical protein